MKKRYVNLLCVMVLGMVMVAGCGNAAEVKEESAEAMVETVVETETVVEESVEVETTEEETTVVLTAEELVQMGIDALNEEEPDFDAAYEFFMSAAEENNAEACYQLGRMYYRGNVGEVDYAQAMSWYEKAVANGMVEANFRLAEHYLWNWGVETDYAKALEYIDLALTGTDQNLLGEAMLSKGWLYYKGNGVEQSYETAYEWFMKGAELGNVTCMGYIGGMYEYGEFVPQSYEKSFEWYLKAADLGYVYGMNVIGYFYDKGYGVEEDEEKALEWYRKSAEGGRAEAMENAARQCNELELYDEARMWAEMALEHGRDVQDLLDVLPAERY